MNSQSFSCNTCCSTSCTTGEVYMPGGRWSKYLNIQGRKFKTASCSQCGLTQFYDLGKASKGSNIIDFLFG